MMSTRLLTDLGAGRATAPLGSIVLLFLIAFCSLSMGQEMPELTGTWIRNPSESDDPEEKVRERAAQMVEKSRRRRWGGYPGEDEDLEQMVTRGFMSYIQAAETLEIELQGEEFLVDDGEGRIRIFYIDGKKHTRQTPRGAKLETVSRRVGNQIAVDQKLEKGGKIIERYIFSGDGDRRLLGLCPQFTPNYPVFLVLFRRFSRHFLRPGIIVDARHSPCGCSCSSMASVRIDEAPLFQLPPSR